MSDNLIQWPKAKYWTKQWNPFIGCKPCSPACENCYAAAWAKRFGQSFEPHVTKQKPPRSGIVFCGNMTDLFGEWCGAWNNGDPINHPERFIEQATFSRKSNATYMWLTKRVDCMCLTLRGIRFKHHLSNHHFGFTAENQEWYDRRTHIWRCDAPCWAKGWLSAEPLLGPIDLGLRYIAPENMPFEWVVVGCESGPKRRPCKIEWVESIVAQCIAARIPVFVKQVDIGGKCVTDITKFPEHLRIRQVPWAKEKI